MKGFRNSQEGNQEGAALVEFAMVLPLLLVLIFGIMEAGWFFAQQVEVRNAAREGARLAVVDYPNPGDAAAIIDETCSRADFAGTGVAIGLSQNGSGATASAVVIVSKAYQSLTGFLPMFDGATISSTAEMRIERDSVAWGPMTKACP